MENSKGLDDGCDTDGFILPVGGSQDLIPAEFLYGRAKGNAVVEVRKPVRVAPALP